MKAVVIADKYDDEEVVNDLRTLLLQYNVEMKMFISLDELKRQLPTLENEPHFFFPNPYVRYENIPELIKLHSDTEFSIIRSGLHTISFIPRLVIISQDTFIGLYRGYCTFSVNIKVNLKKPNVSRPRIILGTHHRDTYLRLTLNSLINALQHCPEIPVSIVINAPTPGIRAVALDFQSQFEQVEVLEVEQNIGFAGTNVGIQWYKPEVVIHAEDDFILPNCTPMLYPVWPYQLVVRLSHFNRAGFTSDLSNLPLEAYQDWADFKTETRLGWLYQINDRSVMPPTMGLYAYRTSLWKACYCKERQTAIDQDILSAGHICATTFLRPYHIGWNYQDKFYNHSEYLWACDKVKTVDKVNVQNLRTNEQRVITLSDAIK
jgi:hypothetical protein